MTYFVHFGLEIIGGGIGVFAYRFCVHNWHRISIWLMLTALSTFITVQLAG